MNELDEGNWLVTQLDQLIATFYLPLPEPLGLDNGRVLATYLPTSQKAVNILSKSNLELAYQSLDDPSHVIIQTADERQAGAGQRQFWFNKVTLSSSLLVHQVAADPWARSGIDTAVAVAQTTSGNRFENPGGRLSTIEGRPALLDELLVDLTEAGVGAVTVIEAAVPTRLIGTVPDISDTMRDEVYIRGEVAPDTLLDLWPFIDSGSSELQVSDLLRRLYSGLAVAIDDVRLTQKAYHLITRHPITLLTRERLPHLLPFTLRRLRDIGDPERSHRGFIAVNENMWSLLSPPVLEPQQLNQLNHARRQVGSGTFSAHLDLYREADAALHRQGDSRIAALFGAVSAESLLDELLLHLKWEEALTPEEAVDSWTDGLNNRVKHEYAQRLGGSWNLGGDTAIGAWSTQVANLRHRTVHGGYVPTTAEASSALKTVDQLVNFLCDRLASPRVLRRYPRTAIMLAGETGLERRQSYTRRLKELQSSVDEPLWADTFNRWKQAHSRLRGDAISMKRVPNLAESYLLEVVHPDNTKRWCMHDRNHHLAVPIKIEKDRLTKSDQRGLELLSAKLLTEDLIEPVSISLNFSDATKLEQIGPWVEEYHLVPLAGVMVDKSDYNR